VRGKAIIFDVIGEPDAQKRPRARRRGPHVGVYQEKSMWYGVVAHEAGLQRQNGVEPCEGPVRMFLTFRMKRRKGLPKTFERPHIVAPDVDNLAKTVMDCVQHVLMGPDSQVVALTIVKRYALKDEPPGCAIVIAEARLVSDVRS
jgi:Holliday junction resolvase RusA-like endonuclease